MTFPIPAGFATAITAVQLRTQNVAPKVAYPLFFGFPAGLLCCVLDHYNIHIDLGTAMGVILTIMAAIGYYSPATLPSQHTKTVSTEEAGNGNGGIQP